MRNDFHPGNTGDRSKECLVLKVPARLLEKSITPWRQGCDVRNDECHISCLFIELLNLKTRKKLYLNNINK